MLGAWGLYAYGLIQTYKDPTPAFKIVLIVIGVEFVALIIGTISWVGHHLNLHQKFGPRTRVTKAEWDYKEDWNGYKVEGNFDQLKKEQVVIITCDHKTMVKNFSSTPGELTHD